MSEPGVLIPIGGHEDRDGERAILRAVAGAMRPGPLLILATASRQPFRYIARYREAFGGIGVHDVRELTVRDRTDAEDPNLTDLIDAAGGVFITGGSQLRLIEPIRDSAVHEALRRLHESGGVIAGTSAGASALGSCMLAGNRELRLTTGLGLIEEVLIDQHFAQRPYRPAEGGCLADAGVHGHRDRRGHGAGGARLRCRRHRLGRRVDRRAPEAGPQGALGRRVLAPG
jgi:cyanophycinase